MEGETQVAYETESESKNIINKIALIIMAVFSFLFPIFINPFGMGAVIDFPKWTLLFVVAGVMMILTGLYMFLERKVIIADRKSALLVLGFGAVAVVSTLAGQGEFRSLLYSRTGLFLGLSLLYLTSSTLIKDKLGLLINTLLTSSVILSLVQFLAFFGILPKILKSSIFASKAFTPVGNQLFLAEILIVTAIITVFKAFNSEEIGKKVLMFVLTGVQVIALVFAVSQILPGQDSAPRFLNFSYGWSITVDQLKQAKSGLVGVGTDNFGTAFRKLRNSAMNSGENWALTFNSSSNEWFMIFTTMGILGGVLFVLMNLNFVRAGLGLDEERKPILWSFLALLVMISLSPGNYLVYFLLFLLGLVMLKEFKPENDVEVEVAVDNPVFSVPFYVVVGLIFILLPVAILSPMKNRILGQVSIVNFIRADNQYNKSLKYYTENRGVEAYNAQIKAIELNPFNVNYRLTYSNTCLALANALASNENLTDEERQNITQLVSQSIREAKAAIALAPENSNLWLNLAQLYRGLLSFAEGADQWALSSYVQAIRLDNTNPKLRLDLGGLLFALGGYEDAIDQFKQAISLKPDYANAYYNLAYAYRQNEQIVQSYNAMQNVVALIDVNSADYERALNELKELQKLLPADQQSATAAAEQRESQLTKPEPTPEPAPNQVDINDQGLAPEADGQVVESGFEDVVNQNPEATGTGEVQGEYVEEGYVDEGYVEESVVE